MIEIFFSLIFFIILSVLTGLFFLRYILSLDVNIFKISEIGLIGISFLTFLSFLIHFFFPLNAYVNLITVILLIFLGIFKNIQFISNCLKKNFLIFLISLVVVFLMTLNYNPHEDYGYYHLPYIINLISEKIIFGLSNLQPQFGWNSSWLNFSALFYLPIIGLNGLHMSNPILFFFVLYLFLEIAFNQKDEHSISKYFLVLLSFYLIIKFSRIAAHGFDFPANIFLLFSFYYFLKLNEASENLKLEKYFIIILIFSTLALTIKLSTFMSPLIVFSSLFLIRFKNIKKKSVIKSFFFCVSFFSFWLIQQFIYSGCFVPMFEFTCFKSVNWYTSEISDSIKAVTGAVNKSVRDYSGTLSEEEYLRNFNWVSTWFNRNKTEFIEHISALLIPFIIILIFNLKYLNFSKKNFLNKKKNYILLITTFLFTLIGLSLWFIKSPVIRFGIPYLYVLSFFIIILIFNYILKINLIFKRGILITLFLALIFNISKNFNRILNFENRDTFWPKILEVEYSSKEIDSYSVNFPDSKIISTQHQFCWSIPFICHIDSGKGIKIYKKNSYLFINQKKDLN